MTAPPGVAAPPGETKPATKSGSRLAARLRAWFGTRRSRGASRRNRRGSITLITGLSLVPLALMMGMGIDATRLFLLRTRLQESVDAAAMMGSIGGTGQSAATIQANAYNLFLANLDATTGTGTSGFMGATLSSANFTATVIDPTHLQVTAKATLPLSLMSLAGLAPQLVSVTSTTLIGGGVEMALVLDISLSMSYQMQDSTGYTKEQALQKAVSAMMDTMYGSSDTLTNMYISVVPFADSVNIGNGHTGWLDGTFATNYKSSVADGSGWRGCVEARQGGNDVTESNASTALFTPMYWPTTYLQYKTVSGKTTTLYVGDNEWTASTITDTNSYDQTQIRASIPQGPNLGCPHSSLLPLTASKTTIMNKVNGLTLTNPGGTIVAQGMQWGWFTVSPNWQGSGGWNLATPAGVALPQKYGVPTNTKVIVLMTDGTSEQDGAEMFYGAASSGQYAPDCSVAYKNQQMDKAQPLAPECITSSGGTNAPKAAAWANTGADSWYTSYGRVSNGRLISPPASTGNQANDSNTASTTAGQVLDTKLSTLCTAAKAQGIVVYTIYFHSPLDDSVDTILGAGTGSAAAASLLQGCATDSSHYFNSTSTAAINSAFLTIARMVNALRLVK